MSARTKVDLRPVQTSLAALARPTAAGAISALPLLLALVALPACSSSGDRVQEVSIATSDKAQDILGISLLLSGLKDRRESKSLRAWSFRLTNNEKENVKVRAIPAFISEDGRDLGGASEAQEVELLPGRSQDFYIKAPTGEVARLVVRFERK
ncbi:MAG: hypothetical protein FD180_4399 [Planctomycetota bacterium]|nr:MAG: hypothetical protein FD180_4399 [Planctomycetota bacterium]